jgi:hypothetical protein
MSIHCISTMQIIEVLSIVHDEFKIEQNLYVSSKFFTNKIKYNNNNTAIDVSILSSKKVGFMNSA